MDILSYTKKYCYIIIISIIIAIYSYNYLSIYENQDMETFFIVSFGNIIPFGSFNILHIIVVLLPVLVQLYLFSDILSSDFQIISVYVFTRLNCRAKWLFNKYLIIFLCIIVSYILQFITIIIFGLISGLSISSFNNLIYLMIILFIILTLSSMIYLTICNLLALKIKQHLSFFAIWGAYCFFLLISTNLKNLLDNWVIKLLPTSQFILAWHDDRILNQFYNGMFVYKIDGFSLTFSYIYIIIILVITLIIGMFYIEKLEISIDAKEV